jgi:hypothetical protein
VPFEVLDTRMIPLAKAPSATIQKRGVISLKRAAHDLLGGADTVELLYDQDRRVMALHPADDSTPHAYAIRTSSTRGLGQAMVAATAFTQHYGIDTTATRRWKRFIEDGMLCVDLTAEGTVITGNRTRTTAPAAPEKLADSPAPDTAPDSSIKDHPVHP